MSLSDPLLLSPAADRAFNTRQPPDH